MMSELAPFTPAKAYEIMEAVLIRGDLSRLNPQERAKYYVRMCESVGLNPLTKPFEYLTLNGKLVLYALKACTDQLRAIHNVSVTELTRVERDGAFIVTAKVTDGNGRTDADIGAVNIAGLHGDVLANAMMKAATKAKRRATLSLCGLGLLDESELETIPAAARAEPKEPPARTVVRTIMPAPKHALKPDGLANRAIAARNANKWDGDGLPGDLGPPREQPRDRESHRVMMRESVEPLDHTDHGGIPAFCVRRG